MEKTLKTKPFLYAKESKNPTRPCRAENEARKNKYKGTVSVGHVMKQLGQGQLNVGLADQKCWSATDPEIVSWLYSLNIQNTEKYITIFTDHEVNLKSLKFLNERDLRKMGITAVGTLSTLLFAIKDLQGEDFVAETQGIESKSNNRRETKLKYKANEIVTVSKQRSAMTQKEMTQAAKYETQSNLNLQTKTQNYQKPTKDKQQTKSAQHTCQLSAKDIIHRKKTMVGTLGSTKHAKIKEENVKPQQKHTVMQERSKLVSKPSNKGSVIVDIKGINKHLLSLEEQIRLLVTSSQVLAPPSLQVIDTLQNQLEVLRKQIQCETRDTLQATVSQLNANHPKAPPSSPQPSESGDTDMRKSFLVAAKKEALLKEIKKQKLEKKEEIQQLEEELSRVKFVDRKSLEIRDSDIFYSELDKIGEGRFSKVYRGCLQGADVVVKQLKITLDLHDKNHFLEEAALLKDLSHPRIVLPLGVCTKHRQPLLILEHLPGGSLYSLLHDTNRMLSEDMCMQIARDICLGMSHLHQHRPPIVHLNLNSNNVLLGSNNRAKITDFGFSKYRYEAEQNSKSVTMNLAWKAPELLTCSDISTKSDVYSFGIIVWEMASRQLPYDGLSMFQLIERVKHNRRPLLPSNCPAFILELIEICWKPKPMDRPTFKAILGSIEDRV